MVIVYSFLYVYQRVLPRGSSFFFATVCKTPMRIVLVFIISSKKLDYIRTRSLEAGDTETLGRDQKLTESLKPLGCFISRISKNHVGSVIIQAGTQSGTSPVFLDKVKPFPLLGLT
jgi:hypothetical protein